MMMQLYDQENINELNFPETENEQVVKRYWLPFLKHGISHFIKNIDAEIKLMQIDQHILPIVLTNTDTNIHSSYVASFYTHYVTYAKEELKELDQPWLERILSVFLSALGGLLRACRMNRVVYVNNWLLSTNLYPELSYDQLNRITSFLKKQFPDRAIVFRSVNEYSTKEIHSSLHKLDYLMLGSRQVYFARRKEELTKNQRKQLYRDESWAEKQGYKWSTEDLNHSENLARCLTLYNALYIDRYSKHNPQFTLSFMDLILKERLMTLISLSKDNRIEGILGYIHKNGTMTTPILGYNTTLPVTTGLYRMLTARLNIESEAHDFVLHRSSGAASFKKNRGAVSCLEYSAVYTKHIPLRQRMGWKILTWIINRIAIPIIQKSGL